MGSPFILSDVEVEQLRINYLHNYGPQKQEVNNDNIRKGFGQGEDTDSNINTVRETFEILLQEMRSRRRDNLGPPQTHPGKLLRVLALIGYARLRKPHAAMTLSDYADDMPLKLVGKKIPAEARLKREDIYWGTLLAICEMIRGGTTCLPIYARDERGCPGMPGEQHKGLSVQGLIGLINKRLDGVEGKQEPG